MKKRNPGDITAKQQARKEYQKKKRIKRQEKFKAAVAKKVKVLLTEINRLSAIVKQNELEKKNEQKG